MASDSSPLPCVCGRYHLTTTDRLKWHPSADPTPTAAEQRVNSTAVRAILARKIAAIPESRVIDKDWCWRCGVVCNRDHEVERPRMPLPRSA